MGKGLNVSISNSLPVPLTIDYSNIENVHQHGEQGSNFDPITGTLQPGQSLSQYIEASFHVVWVPSKFSMNLHGNFDSFSLDFSEQNSTWSVTPKTVSSGEVQVTAIAVPGTQDTINVGIHRHASWLPQSWMSDLSSIIGDRPINQIAIPGSHDSGTSAITPLSPIAPDQDVTDRLNYLWSIPAVGLATNAVIAGWSKSQHLTILDQLIAGIRYLDLRVVLSGSDYYICHGMYSWNFDVVVADVKKFVAEFPKEIIIFDINHLHNFQKEPIKDAEHMGLISKLFEAFGDKMAPNSLIATTPLSTFQESGYQIIALYALGYENVVSNPTLNQGGRLWSQNRMYPSSWVNQHNLDELVPALLTFRLLSKAGTNSSKLCWLTHELGYIRFCDHNRPP